ncbi:unnamed protein product [Mytilus coruscus]|uniref:B box-type domain-containing protein n=1 Tax=Mytilus coruscus TaxID=42192 RepID=A0A6J8F184_MYTCO|nr:unnamed protein product [Mytilus coruscus]
MATSQQHLCDVCMNQHITQTAIIYCPECEENFCEKCKIHHEFAKATKKHEIISIENVLRLPKFVQDIKINCSQHDERFVLYCDTHEVRCCTQCLHDAHAGCRNLTSFQKVIQNIKESSLCVDLETTLSDLMTNLTNIIEDRTANLQDLEEQKTRCKKKIKAHREAINTYFDELETDLMDNLQKTFTEKEIGIQNMLDDFQLRKSNVCEMQENVNIIKRIASEFQSFMAIRKLAKSANSAETDLHHFFENGSLNWTEISYTPTNIDSVKDNLTSIGKTDVKVDPSTIQLKVRKTREAQLIGPIKSNIESIHLKEKFRNKLPKRK